MSTSLYKIFLIIVLFSLAATLAQTPEILWTRTYGGTDYDYSYSLKQTSDGGFIIAGSTKSNGAGDRDIWILKTDSAGNVKWTKTFGGTGFDEAYSVDQNSDGGFIVTGTVLSSPDNYDVFLLRTNESGNLLWFKTFGDSNDQRGQSVIQTHDGYFMITGSYNDSSGFSDAFLLKADSTGNFISTKFFDRNEYDYANDLIQTPTGGFTFCGFTATTDFSYDAWLVCTDPSGNIINNKVYGGNSSEYAESVYQTHDGGYIIGGTTYSFSAGSADFWLIRTDGSGDTLWTKSIGGVDIEIGSSVISSIDGGFLITGYTNSFGSGNRDVWIVKVNSLGDTLWTKTIGGISTDQAFSIIQTNDGGYALCGYTTSYGSGESDVWLIHLSAESPVPVELTSFSAVINESDIQLIWSTATEINNYGFELEKAVNTESARINKWETIGFVEGYGTTTEPVNYSFTDKYVSGIRVVYRLKQLDFDGRFEYSPEVNVNLAAPNDFHLYQNYPNPFNPTTKIKFTIPISPQPPLPSKEMGEVVTLKVYDILGNEITTLVNEEKSPGTYEVEFNAGNLSSGIYFYKLQSGNYSETKKLIMMK